MGTGLGGAPKALHYIINYCFNKGFDCYVACLDCQEVIDYFSGAGAKCIVLDDLPYYVNSTTESYPVGSKKFINQRKHAQIFKQKWKNIIKDNGGFDLVFINSMTLCDLILPSKEIGCKVIQVVRETAQPGESLTIMKELFHKADFTIFISEYDQRLFSLQTPSCVIKDGGDPDLYRANPYIKYDLRKKNNIKQSAKVILFTGGFHDIKGSGFLIDLFLNFIPKEKIVVLWAGYSFGRGFKQAIKKVLSYFFYSDKFLAQKILKNIKKLNQSNKFDIRLIGFSNNIEQYYIMADVCLVPYRVPHQAMPIFESGFSSIPCIVSDWECFNEEVVNMQTGFLVKYGDVKGWIRAIQDLIKDDELRIRLGEFNYHNAINNHNINTILESHIEVIYTVMGIPPKNKQSPLVIENTP
jgi:glycosyltransferase involved in cell wall biosynthesis